METGKISDNFSSITENVKDYINLRIDLAKLILTEKIAQLAAFFLIAVIFFIRGIVLLSVVLINLDGIVNRLGFGVPSRLDLLCCQPRVAENCPTIPNIVRVPVRVLDDVLGVFGNKAHVSKPIICCVPDDLHHALKNEAVANK